MPSRQLALVTAALLLTACAPDVAVSGQEGLGTSDLAPSMAPERAHKQHPGAHAGTGQSTRRPKPRATTRPVAATTAPATPAPSRAPAPAKTAAPTPDTTQAAVSDPTGDVRGSLTGAPAYVDLTGARLTRSGRGFELRVGFADAVPAAQTSDGRTVNVASFYDVDGDGRVDYEIWASLADDGWSGSYRHPTGARYGGDSGVAARADGRQLVITFPLGHLQDADAFRWSVGAEWGSYEQVASGTTARDTAPDAGVMRFPG